MQYVWVLAFLAGCVYYATAVVYAVTGFGS